MQKEVLDQFFVDNGFTAEDASHALAFLQSSLPAGPVVGDSSFRKECVLAQACFEWLLGQSPAAEATLAVHTPAFCTPEKVIAGDPTADPLVTLRSTTLKALTGAGGRYQLNLVYPTNAAGDYQERLQNLGINNSYHTTNSWAQQNVGATYVVKLDGDAKLAFNDFLGRETDGNLLFAIRTTQSGQPEKDTTLFFGDAYSEYGQELLSNIDDAFEEQGVPRLFDAYHVLHPDVHLDEAIALPSSDQHDVSHAL